MNGAMGSTDATQPDPSIDRSLLQAAVRRGLLDRDAAKAYWARVKAGEGRAAALLVADGLLTQHVIESLSSASDALGPGSRLGSYRIIERLGRGGMGTVFRARHDGLGRDVALKLMAPAAAADADGVKRFLREARAAARISHPNVITVHDVGQERGRLYMALELVEGGDAAQLAAAAGGRLDEARALAIVRDACRGLAAIHAQGLVHRDIKPANILIAADGSAKLADLGLARTQDGEDKLTITGAAVGTPAYMSPEQAAGEAVDIRSDLYALGATLFALVCGREPHVGSNAFAVIKGIVNDPPPDPRSLRPELSVGCAQLILRLLAKAPAERPPQPEALLADLERVIAGGAPTPSGVATRTGTPPATRRFGRGAWILAGLAVLLLLALLLLSRGDRPASAAPPEPAAATGPAIASDPVPEPTVEPATTPVVATAPPAAAQTVAGALTLVVPDVERLRQGWADSAYRAVMRRPAFTPQRLRIEAQLKQLDSEYGLDLERLLGGIAEIHAGLHPWPEGERPVGADPLQLRARLRNAPGQQQLWGFLSDEVGASTEAEALWHQGRYAERRGDWVHLLAPANRADWERAVPGAAVPPGDLGLAWRLDQLAAQEPRELPLSPAQLALLARFDGALASSLDADGSSEHLTLSRWPRLFVPVAEGALTLVSPQAVAALAAGIDGDALLALLAELAAVDPEIAAWRQQLASDLAAAGLPSLEQALAGRQLQLSVWAGGLSVSASLSRGGPLDRWFEAAISAQGYAPSELTRAALPLTAGVVLRADGERWLIGTSVAELDAALARASGLEEPAAWQGPRRPALGLWVDSAGLALLLAQRDGRLRGLLRLRAALAELQPSTLALVPDGVEGYTGRGRNLLGLLALPLLMELTGEDAGAD